MLVATCTGPGAPHRDSLCYAAVVSSLPELSGRGRVRDVPVALSFASVLRAGPHFLQLDKAIDSSCT